MTTELRLGGLELEVGLETTDRSCGGLFAVIFIVSFDSCLQFFDSALHFLPFKSLLSSLLSNDLLNCFNSAQLELLEEVDFEAER